MAKTIKHDSATGRSRLRRIGEILREFANPWEIVARTQCGELDDNLEYQEYDDERI